MTRLLLSILCLFLVSYHAVTGFSPAAALFSATRARNLLLRATEKPKSQQLLGEVSSLINDLAKGKVNKKTFEEKISVTEVALSETMAQQEKLIETGSVVGMGLIGLVTGLLADLPLGGQVDSWIPPLAGAALLSGGSYYSFTAKDKILIRTSAFIKSFVGETAVDTAKSISEGTMAYIAAKTLAAKQKKVDTLEYLNSIPRNAKTTMVDSVDGFKLSIRDKVDSTIAQIKQLPVDAQASATKRKEDEQAKFSAKVEVMDSSP